jgi:bla regulator protein blaR1
MIPGLTNHLWQSTLFAVAAGLLTVAFRKNRAQVRYWLWLSASLKFFVPFSLLMSLGSHLRWPPTAMQTATETVSVRLAQITQPFPDSLSFVPAAPGSFDWTAFAIPLVWACGFAAIALMRLRSWLRIRAAVARAHGLRSTALELSTSVEVRSSPSLLEPGVVGILRPILLLPEGIAQRLTPPQLEAVLAHELCHVRRCDNLFAAIHMVVEATFWFHPLVWWIGARLVEERERACDEGVLSLGSEPRVYAEAILSVCKLYVESPLACMSGVTGADLRRRLEAIMTNRTVLKLGFAKKVTLAVAGAAALAAPIVVGTMNAPAIRAQAQSSAPSAAVAPAKFEVASIKPSADCGGHPLGRPPNARSPGRLSACAPVEDLIHWSYVVYADGLRARRILGGPAVSGGPAWIHSDLYQIDAKAEGPASEGMMSGPMMQALLEDRFKLKIRRESREVPVYALTVARSGPKLQPFHEGSCTPVDFAKGLPPSPGQKSCSAVIAGGGPNLTLKAQAASLDYFSKLLSLAVDRPVIDKTGITGLFDFHLVFAKDEVTPRFLPGGDMAGPRTEPSDDPAGPTIFTAIQQFGLKLEPAKGPLDFLVIDRVDRPTEN